MTVAEIKVLATEKGYNISGSNKANLITSFIDAQTASEG